MKVAIDAFRLVCEKHTSGHMYVRELACSLVLEQAITRVLLLVPTAPDDELKAYFGPMPKVSFVVDATATNPVRSWFHQTRWIQLRIPKILMSLADTDRPDGLIAPYHQTPIFVQRRIRVAAVIHDLCGVDPQSGYKKWRWPYIKHVINFITARIRADVMLPISEFTRRTLIARYPDVASRVTAPVHNSVTTKTIDEDVFKHSMEKLGIHGKYFLAFSALGPRKGTDLTLDAYCEYRKMGGHAALILLGGKDANEHWKSKADLLDVPNMVWLSGVSDTERDALYAGAEALIFPSRCEGFGYPIVEAMRQGCPVIATKDSPAEELVGTLMPTLHILAVSEIASEMLRYSRLPSIDRAALRSRLVLHSQRFLSPSFGEAFVSAMRRNEGPNGAAQTIRL